ncbi:hypothetical protein [Nocardia sp. CA-290969]
MNQVHPAAAAAGGEAAGNGYKVYVDGGAQLLAPGRRCVLALRGGRSTWW